MSTQRFLLAAVCMVGLAGASFCSPIVDTDPDVEPSPEWPMDDPFELPLPSVPPDFDSPRPPPISGGTLMVSRDGSTALAADPDRDRIYLVDLDRLTLRTELPLQSGDEPGRSVEDGSGRAHVALRRGGALVSVDLRTGALLERRPVCAAPRGIAYEPATDQLHVACATGELVSLPASGGAEVRRLQLERDLRDVVLSKGRLLISQFKTATLLELDAAGVVRRKWTPQAAAPNLIIDGEQIPTHFPAVAWRTLAWPDGQVAMLHQRARRFPVSAASHGYGSGCTSEALVHSAVTRFDADGIPNSGAPFSFFDMVVDLALSPDGTQVAIVSPNERNEATVQTLSISDLVNATGCSFGLQSHSVADHKLPATAIAYDARGRLLVQSREPAELYVLDGTTRRAVTLSLTSQLNYGHRMFHTPTSSGIACASCHPEGGEDGQVWNFQDLGLRRTQSLRTGLASTAPYHWVGDQSNLEGLLKDVYSGRMGGRAIVKNDVAWMEQWLFSLPSPAPAPAGDPQAVQQGRILFESPAVGCASCHGGPQLTNNQTVSVGTGGAFQVPSLIGVGARAPFLHDGCAKTLRQRFTTCGGGDAHGHTSQLSALELDQLTAYLESL